MTLINKKLVFSFIHEVLFSSDDIPASYRAIRHLIAGGFGTLIYLAGVALLVELGGMHPVTSVIICTLLLDVLIYLVSRLWVYDSTMGHSHAIPRFIFILGLAMTLNTGIMYVTVNILELWYVWGLVIATVIVPATNFSLSYFWAFR